MLDIIDKEGLMPKSEMRECFEELVTKSKELAGNTPLGAMLINGEFKYYMNKDTDTLWIGFCLGMRTMQRILK